jgi:DNA repair protein SbcC/Rad50
MLLKQLKLQNIRSYVDQTINFSEGSTLLSGDIGSGKSTVLLAIEFALFGTSRPELPGEMLLRKGATQASVELTFVLNNQEIIIRRNLKKDKDSVKQLPGYILFNGMKKDLTPVELKAEIISLLGYPEEFITKNKNYIFRYTIYTPQEEMKFILQESSDARLDVLRKIFNIDKYKAIRDNLQNYMRKMRGTIAELKTRTEPLEELSNELNELNQEELRIKKELDHITPQIREIKQQITSGRESLTKMEQHQKKMIDVKQMYKTTLTQINDKNQLNQNLKLKKEQLTLELNNQNFKLEEFEQIKLEILELEKEKSELITKKSSLKEKIYQLQKRVQDYQKDIIKSQENIDQVQEKEKLKIQLIQEITEKEVLKQKRLQLEELFGKTSELVTKNDTLLSQSKEMQNKINALSNCPTCLQTVSNEHKNNIVEQEQNKIRQAENLLFELNKKKSQIYGQKEEVNKILEELTQKENLLTKTKLELIQFGEKTEDLNKKRELLKSVIQENNYHMQSLNAIEKEGSLDKIVTKINILQEKVSSYSKLILMKKQLDELKEQISKGEEQIEQMQKSIVSLEEEIGNDKDFSKEIEDLKLLLDNRLITEKELSVKQAQLQTNFNNIVNQKERISKNLDKLKEQKNKLTRLKELHHWLDAHFLKLTYTIEKQVMLNIHQLFNQLFQEWFSMLIDDENVYAKLDDTFSPVIEQNGYDVSFNTLSGGEKTSAALAYRLALNKVINDVVSNIRTKDLIILDEPTDGFSSEQLDKVRDVLDRLGLKQVILVSHESKVESFVENVIRIVKDGHVSVVY